MASLLNASTTGLGGLISTGDSSGVLSLQTAGTTALNIDSTQNVGVNAGMLFVSNSSGNTQFRTGISTNASLSAGEGIEFLTTASVSTRVLSYDRTASAFRVIDLAGSSIRMSPNNSTSVIVNQYGLGLGATSPSSGTGIAFPATPNPSSNANTLDDYEEGTWTPNLVGITTVNFSYNLGNYVKVGRVVTLWWDFTVSSYSGGSWNNQLGGLPFVVSGSQAGYSASRTRDSGLFNSSLATGYQLMFFAQTNQAYLYCQVDNSGTAGFGTASTASLASSGRCTGTITYYATS